MDFAIKERTRNDLPEINVTACADGLNLLSIRGNRYKTGVAAINMYLPMNEKLSAARALVPYLLVRACKRYPDYTALRRRLSCLYGASLRASTGMHGDLHKFSIGIAFLDDKYAINNERISSECVELLLSMLFEPPLDNGLFRRDDVELEKRLMLERIDSQLNDKIRYARLRCIKHMCANEPYGLEPLGERDAVENVTAEEITDAWKEITENARIDAVVSGTFDSAETEMLLKNAANRINRKPVNLPEQMIIGKAENINEITEQADVKQAKLVIGYRTPINTLSGDTSAMRLVNMLFGGMSNSLLFKNVREKMSLCYYCSSAYLRSKGMLFVQSGLDYEQAGLARDAIKKQLEALKNGDFSDTLLQQAKLYNAGICREVNDSPFELADWYSSQMLSSELISPERYIDDINNVSRERIIAAAKTITEDTVYLLVGKDGD